jgi:hypothetical protein
MVCAVVVALGWAASAGGSGVDIFVDPARGPDQIPLAVSRLERRCT